jgi:hypothetical protein
MAALVKGGYLFYSHRRTNSNPIPSLPSPNTQAAMTFRSDQLRLQIDGIKELERENAKLKRLVAELSLEKQILKDVASGNF